MSERQTIPAWRRTGVWLLERIARLIRPTARTPPDLPRVLPAQAPLRILFCRPDHIGDVLLSIPALAWVRARYPAAHLTLLVASWAAPVVRSCADFDELIVCDPPWWAGQRARRFGSARDRRAWAALGRQIAGLRRQPYDLCIEARGDVRQAFCFGTLARSRIVLTRDRHGGTGLADSAPPIDEAMHEIDQNLALVRTLGDAPDWRFPEAFRPFDATDERAVAQLLEAFGIAPTRPVVLAHPGAKWVNRWPEAAWRDWLVQFAQRADASIVLTGSPDEAALCERLAQGRPDTFSAAGRLSLRGTAALMARAALVVMADTGPMHVLHFVPTPSVLLFGPTPPQRFAPRGARVCVLRGAACCATHLHETCTRAAPGAPSACMAAIEVATVVDAACAALARSVSEQPASA